MLWETDGIGYGYAEVLVVGDNVFTHGRTQNGGQLQCMDRLTGRVRWRVAASINDSSTPAWMKDRLYIYARNLVCHDANTGELLWETSLREVLKSAGVAHTNVPDPYYSSGDVQSPLAYDGIVVVVVGQPGATAVALDAKTGKLRWISKGAKQAIGRSWSSAMVVRCGWRDLILAPCTGDLAAIDPADGKIVWEERCYPPERSGNGYIYTWACPPVHSDGFLFVHAGYKEPIWSTFTMEVRGAGIRQAWNKRRIHPFQENVVAANGLLFGTGHVQSEDMSDEPCLLIDGKKTNELPAEVVKRLDWKNRKAGTVLPVDAVSTGLTFVCQDLKTGAVRGVRGLGKGGGFGSHLVSYSDGHLYMGVSGMPDAIYLVEASPALTVQGRLVLPFSEILKLDNQPVKGGWGVWGGYYTRPQVARGAMWVRTLNQLRVYDISAAGTKVPKNPGGGTVPTSERGLTRGLRDEYLDVRNYCVESLVRLGALAVPAVMSSLRSDSYYAKLNAARVAARLPADAASSELLDQLIVTTKLPGQDQERQLWAATALVRLATSRPQTTGEVDRAIGMLVDGVVSHPTARAMLAAIGEPATRSLVSRMGTQDKTQLWAIIETLGQIGDAAGGAVPELVKQLESPRDQWFAALTCHTLGLIGKRAADAVPILLTTLKTQKYDNARLEAVWALWQIGVNTNAVATALREVADSDSSEKVRSASKTAVDALCGK